MDEAEDFKYANALREGIVVSDNKITEKFQ